MRILLIENDFSLGRKLKNLLEKNRYTVDETNQLLSAHGEDTLR